MCIPFNCERKTYVAKAFTNRELLSFLFEPKLFRYEENGASLIKKTSAHIPQDGQLGKLGLNPSAAN